MEQQSPPFVTQNFLELPKSLFIDLSDELLPLRNLTVEFHPYFTDRDFQSIVRKLVSALTDQLDIDYQLSEFAITSVADYFEPFKCVSQDRLSEVQQILMTIGRMVYNKISSHSGYVHGIFPYKFMDIQLNCELFLQNTAFLNYNIELNHKPFQFAI